LEITYNSQQLKHSGVIF